MPDEGKPPAEPPHEPHPSVLPVAPDTLPSTSKISHDRYIQLLTFFGGLPAVVVCLTLLWAGDWTPKVQWTFSTLAVGVWLGCVAAVRERVIYPMQTLTNLLAALREGDYSLRSRRARRDDALGDVMREINALGETLSTRRREATEALTLLRAIMAEIDVAVFTFDDHQHLRLVNRTAALLLRGDDKSLVGRAAGELGLADCLAGDTHRTLTADFPGGKSGARWSLHRSSFRQAGRPHQLLVLADVSAPLREEERAAWQRLIRVLGHEINNSLTPIGSIAGSIGTLLERPEPQRASDWQEDVREGLGIIGARAESLGRFMGAYSRLARLPAPVRRRQEIAPLVRHAAVLETRLTVAVDGEETVEADVDGDQLEQALINLVRNATDAALETGGGVRASWTADDAELAIFIDDEGHGLGGTANLFVPFFTTKPQGSGIGLVLSRQIAEAHGGTLTLENRPDGVRGCRATLRLPG